MGAYTFHPSILREYDIRGIVPETLTKTDAYWIGRGFASFIREKTGKDLPRIAVAYDGRLTSPDMQSELCRGLSESGAEVVRVGLGPTPMLYFAVTTLALDGGIMVTGSHNPPTHNGFKFMNGLKPYFGEDIQKLGARVKAGDLISATGKITEVNIKGDYIKKLVSSFGGARKLNVAWDAGNGATGEVMAALCKQLPGAHFPLFETIDGNFPNHHPDPSVAKNLTDVIATVKSKGCDVGLAFDGDGDRVGVIDETGSALTGDEIIALFAADVLKKNKGGTIIADVKASQTLFDFIGTQGGKALMWRTGHSHIKNKMKELNSNHSSAVEAALPSVASPRSARPTTQTDIVCPFAGEMSGHIFFADDYYGFDDGIYAAIRMLNIVAGSDVPLSKLRRCLPPTVSTPEIRFACADDKKFAIVEGIKSRLMQEKATVNDIDGVRVSTKDGWWLLRASNTQAVLVARCESTSEEGLMRLKKSLQAQLEPAGLHMPEESDPH